MRAPRELIEEKLDVTDQMKRSKANGFMLAQEVLKCSKMRTW
jgi:hypothetical protein